MNSFTFQSKGARAVFQFYPENSQQIEMITTQSMKAGFTGGLVVDYPNSTKAKKYFLVLMTSGGAPQQMPKALGDDSGVQNESKREKYKRMRSEKKGLKKGSRDWIMEKKERRRKKGKETQSDSKFSGRKRAGKMF